MPDNVINFTNAKKRASYAKKELQASENRTKFGRTKTEKRADAFDKSKAKTHLDDHKLDDE